MAPTKNKTTLFTVFSYPRSLKIEPKHWYLRGFCNTKKSKRSKNTAICDTFTTIAPVTRKFSGIPGATLPQTSMLVLKAPRQPRKTKLRCCTCRAYHQKMQRRPRRHASANIYARTESATPATQNEAEVLHVSRLPPENAAASQAPRFR